MTEAEASEGEHAPAVVAEDLRALADVLPLDPRTRALLDRAADLVDELDDLRACEVSVAVFLSTILDACELGGYDAVKAWEGDARALLAQLGYTHVNPTEWAAGG